MDVIQDMSNRKLLNTRNKAVEGLLFGMENWDAVDAFDRELLKRGIIKKTTRQEFQEDNKPKHTVLV